MARQLRSNLLETRTARQSWREARKPYWFTVAPGISLATGATQARAHGPSAPPMARAATGSRAFAVADDREDADGATVLDVLAGRRQGEGAGARQDADAGRPSTVDEALTDYATDLAVRGGGADQRDATRAII